MKKKDFLNYLDERLTEKMLDFDVALDWDTKNHTIEIIFRLFAENKGQQAIDDATGVVSEEEVIEFEDGILLYNPQKSKFVTEDYLTTIAYEGKKGLSVGFINGLVDYLNDVLTTGMDDLLDFLSDDSEAEVFELKWQAADLQASVEKYAAEANEYLAYPSY
ncbi:hypothetical protein M2139_002044 [Enterococcus sp. PF1-24]|uniref:DUF3013 family protein n=1 Tax=unclassified Enterococcus TaxID=2608891 RepID=UPI002474DA02|nr:MULTISPECIES: DUF3013 family protein [unclassified Enterococcus]MDH6365083.1 hypothetical protein [Enterococcus sp. PFB1-1]MDH6402144.1 hypothetical protein [Enterococcus sp. PF1-24]